MNNEVNIEPLWLKLMRLIVIFINTCDKEVEKERISILIYQTQIILVLKNYTSWTLLPRTIPSAPIDKNQAVHRRRRLVPRGLLDDGKSLALIYGKYANVYSFTTPI